MKKITMLVIILSTIMLVGCDYYESGVNDLEEVTSSTVELSIAITDDIYKYDIKIGEYMQI